MAPDLSESNYQQRYGQYQNFERLIAGEYPLIADALAEQIVHSFPQGSSLSALDVGCGTGRMALELSSRLRQHGIGIVFDYLDPVPRALWNYHDAVPESLRRTAYNCSWADYVPREPHDVVLANNSLCGLDARVSANITKFRDAVKPSGLALITLPSEQGVWVRAARGLWQDIHGASFSKTAFEDIAAALDREHVPYEKRFVSAPVQFAPETINDDLATVFAVMMYVDCNEIASLHAPQFSHFVQSVIGRPEPHALNFIYGIAAVHRVR
jgi:SAM-dependent methyltransferase